MHVIVYKKSVLYIYYRIKQEKNTAIVIITIKSAWLINSIKLVIFYLTLTILLLFYWKLFVVPIDTNRLKKTCKEINLKTKL